MKEGYQCKDSLPTDLYLTYNHFPYTSSLHESVFRYIFVLFSSFYHHGDTPLSPW